MKKNTVKIIVVVAAIFLIVGIVEIVIFSKKENNNTESIFHAEDHYNISPKVEELPGTKVYSNPNLTSSHCYKSICVEDATFYYREDGGRLEYTISNESQEIASGLLKLVFGKQSLIISYQDLAPGAKVSTVSYYSDKKIEKMEEYRIEELSSKDMEKVIYSNK